MKILQIDSVSDKTLGKAVDWNKDDYSDYSSSSKNRIYDVRNSYVND